LALSHAIRPKAAWPQRTTVLLVQRGNTYEGGAWLARRLDKGWFNFRTEVLETSPLLMRTRFQGGSTGGAGGRPSEISAPPPKKEFKIRPPLAKIFYMTY